MKFSIIIPIRSINDYLRESIPHLKNMDYQDFEVIILTDEKETFDFNDGRFKLLTSGKVGPGEKRNLGAKIAAGEILAFLDDDAFPKEDWLQQASSIFQDSEVYALGGPALTPFNAGFLERMSGRILETFMASGGTTYRHVPKKARLIDDYPTVNLMVRKNLFNEVGGFPIEFWPGEDTKLCLDLVNKMGRLFNYDPRPIVYHHRRNVFIKHLKQISRYGQHRGQFARIFPETSRLPSYFTPTLFILGLLLGPFVCMLLPSLWLLYFGVVSLYIFLLIADSLRVSFKEKSLKAFLYIAVGVFLTHLVYGINFLIGLLKKPKLKLKQYDQKTGNYIEG